MRRLAMMAAILFSLASPASGQIILQNICRESVESCADRGLILDPNNCNQCVADPSATASGPGPVSGGTASSPIRPMTPLQPNARQGGLRQVQLRNSILVGNLSVRPLPPAELGASPTRLRCGAIAADGMVTQAERPDWDRLNCAQYEAR